MEVQQQEVPRVALDTEHLQCHWGDGDLADRSQQRVHLVRSAEDHRERSEGGDEGDEVENDGRFVVFDDEVVEARENGVGQRESDGGGEIRDAAPEREGFETLAGAGAELDDDGGSREVGLVDSEVGEGEERSWGG